MKSGKKLIEALTSMSSAISGFQLVVSKFVEEVNERRFKASPPSLQRLETVFNRGAVYYGQLLFLVHNINAALERVKTDTRASASGQADSTERLISTAADARAILMERILWLRQAEPDQIKGMKAALKQAMERPSIFLGAVQEELNVYRAKVETLNATCSNSLLCIGRIEADLDMVAVRLNDLSAAVSALNSEYTIDAPNTDFKLRTDGLMSRAATLRLAAAEIDIAEELNWRVHLIERLDSTEHLLKAALQEAQTLIDSTAIPQGPVCYADLMPNLGKHLRELRGKYTRDGEQQTFSLKSVFPHFPEDERNFYLVKQATEESADPACKNITMKWDPRVGVWATIARAWLETGFDQD
jgi:hypothetical protein